MKYEVIGWTSVGCGAYSAHEPITASVDAAVIKEIRKHKYLFGGDEHEYHCPVLNDGTYVCYSWRGWGRIIALSYGAEGDYAYMCGYMDALIKPKARKYPETKAPDESRMVPKESLTETFEMHLADDMFDAVKTGRKTVEIRLFDEKRKKVDVGDYIEFIRQSDDSDRVKMRVADLDIWETFEKAFSCIDYVKKKRIERLQYTPAQLGAPENATLKSLVDGMYKYYKKEEEKEHGVIAFTLEKPVHNCETCFCVRFNVWDGADIFEERLNDPNLSDEEFFKLDEERFDSFLIEDAFSKIAEKFERYYHFFRYGRNVCYNVDVNVMLRETLKGLFGKEEELKALRYRFCLSLTLEIFSVIIKDSEEPKQCLSLDEDIIEFLHKSGTQLKFGYKVV